MKAPKCKLCGEEHWSPVCPKFNTKPRAAVAAIKAPDPALAEKAAQRRADKAAGVKPVKKAKKAKRKKEKAA